MEGFWGQKEGGRRGLKEWVISGLPLGEDRGSCQADHLTGAAQACWFNIPLLGEAETD